MRRSFWGFTYLTLGFFILAGTLHSQERRLVQVTPAQVGMSETALNELTTYLQSEVDARRVAGAVGMVARHGRIAYFEAVGDAERDSLFRLASMTKAVTTVAVMQLVEEGKVKLEDPVSKHLPEFSSLKVIGEDGISLVDVAGEPTLHHLLTHTSGIGYGWGDGYQDKAYQDAGVQNLLIPNKDTLEEHINKLARLPFAFNPGEQWFYGQSLDVLGRVVEVVSKLTLQQYFQERIFRPLGMKDTAFYLNKSQQNRLVSLYTPGENGGLVEVGSEVLSAGEIQYAADLCYEGKGNLYAGGSGLAGSTMDYMRFLQMLLNGGTLEGVKILDESTVKRMTQNHIGDLTIAFPGHGESFGYGFGVLTERGKADDVASVGTYSWGGIFNTYYWVDPQEELIGLVMTQIFPNDHLKIRENFKRLAYEAIDDSGFSRRYWFEKGKEHGNPFFNKRQLRVNSPGVGVHPVHATRSETRSSGLARILIQEDLRSIVGAELYCEIWGGHPGTSDKRVSVNGRVQIRIPETGTASDNCTHQYPRFKLAPGDLVNGYNSLQFACDKPGLDWGHFIVDNAALDIRLPANHPDITEAGWDGFSATVTAAPDTESIQLSLATNHADAISHVVYQARYYGYDENGNGWETDWHGMTKAREAHGMLGRVDKAPFELDWNVSMLPAQTAVEVKAFVYLNAGRKLIYQTPALKGLEIARRSESRVSLIGSRDLPKPFWSRAERLKECSLELDIDPARIEAVELHVVAWAGGAGEVKDYFTLNGEFLPVAEESGHEVIYSVLPVDPKRLKQGENRIRLLSDTEHHGIEILLPGPALVIRSKLP